MAQPTWQFTEAPLLPWPMDRLACWSSWAGQRAAVLLGRHPVVFERLAECDQRLPAAHAAHLRPNLASNSHGNHPERRSCLMWQSSSAADKL